jgi:four helix bundle protein
MYGMASHRDLAAWQAARASYLAIQRYSDAHWRPERGVVFDQVRRSSLSVMLNLSEGYACGPGRRCRWHFRVAYASAVETTDVLEALVALGSDLSGEVELSRRVQALTIKLWQRSKK